MSTHERTPTERPGPPGGARDRNRRKKTKSLERAALRLFLSSGIANVTIDQIAKRAKMAKGSFYRYAESKADVVTRLLGPLRIGLTKAYARSRAALLKASTAELPLIYLRLAGELSDLINTYPDVVRLYLQESRAPARSVDRQAVLELALVVRSGARELTEVAANRDLLGDTPAWLSATVVVGAVEELLLENLSGRTSHDAADVQRGLVNMVLHGISRRPSSR